MARIVLPQVLSGEQSNALTGTVFTEDLRGIFIANDQKCMSTQAIDLPRSQWIISKRDDLIFFIGSALLGYAILATATVHGYLSSVFLLCFAFAVDGPHVFSTLTRALFDSGDRSRVRLLWILGFPACAVGILVLAMLAGADPAFVVVSVLAHYHISKQHMGFVMIYKKKAGERRDFKIDKYFTLVSLMLPLCFYLARLIFNVRSIIPFLAAGIVLATLYFGYQLRKPVRNTPKLGLLLAFIPLQWLAWSFAACDPHS